MKLSLSAPAIATRKAWPARNIHEIGSTPGLPIAAQFVGKPLGEATIVRLGRAFQRVTSWHRRHPKL